VPRIYEKFEEKLKDLASTKGQLAQSISAWAKGYGTAHTEARAKKQSPPLLYPLANFLILSRIKKALGLDQVKCFFYGAAPMKQSSLDYFASLDMPINGGYGLSETTGGVVAGALDKLNIKSTGLAIPGTDLKIDNPDENKIGEICIRGRAIMNGYLNNEKATKEVIDSQGYFHSGDLGKIDENGYLYITGRIKELIITAGGENIPPVILEDTVKSYCPAISNVMVVGENQKFLGAVMTFKVDTDAQTGEPSNNLTQEVVNLFKKELNVEIKTTEEAIANDKVQKYVQLAIEMANKKAVSRAA